MKVRKIHAVLLIADPDYKSFLESLAAPLIKPALETSGTSRTWASLTISLGTAAHDYAPVGPPSR